MRKLYFAYGSCMDKERINNSGFATEFKEIGIACLENYSFRMNKLAGNGQNVYANIMPTPGSSVYGILYEITDRVETKYLDRREGYLLRPRHYDKEYITVNMDNTKFEKVLTYIANPHFIVEGNYPTSESYQLELTRGGEILPAPYIYDFYSEIYKCVIVRETPKTKDFLKNVENTMAKGLETLNLSGVTEWGGAGVVITSKEPDSRDYITVHTKYALELSWLFYMLRDNFSWATDYLNKYEFYGRLAEAANAYLSLTEAKRESRIDLLKAVLKEAKGMLRDLEIKGHFERD